MKKAFQKLNKVPDPTNRLPEEFVLETRPGLLKLFNLEPTIANENKFRELQYDPLVDISKIPEVIWKVIGYGHKEWNIPEEAICKVQVGLYMRKSKMSIPHPEKDVLCRIVLNYGHDERYIHQNVNVSENRSKSYTNVKETVVPANSAILLGPHVLSDNSLFIGSDTKVNLIPEHIPEGIAHSKLNPLGGKTFTLRIRKYQRITIVLDYRGDDEMIRSFMEDLEKEDDNNPLSGLIGKLTGKDTKFNIPKNTKSLKALVESLKSKLTNPIPQSNEGEK